MLRSMHIDDYDELIECWSNTPGVTLNDADSHECIERFLQRNPELSLVMTDEEKNNKIIGTIMCGHDGRRGYLHHMFVDETYRGQGIGKKIFSQVVTRLEKEKIAKAHLMVVNENTNAKFFWEKIGCHQRDDITLFSFCTDAVVA
ncbi:MAG: GNAT family N-acetyltransferase [Planctomycetes bacterium]|nr:GNAT family N-acetyltransferase [Planctomycetota bacterium]